MELFTREGDIIKELDANIQEPFPKEEPKISEINGLLDNGKLTLKTAEDGDITFNFHHRLSLEVKETSTTLQDEIASMEKELSNIQLTKISNSDIMIPNKKFSDRIAAKEKKPSKIQQTKLNKFNILDPDNELSLKISKDEYKWPNTTVDRSNPVYWDIFPLTENFSFSFHSIVKIQADDSDEVKLDGNLQNIIAPRKLSTEDMLSEATYATYDSGTVVFKTQDSEKM
ncbi:hypothetical protein HCN44_000269 [Aphidius gifuensis]|uniref:Uncharacterized protein n=1 Tax=Aphidius gifuensis TaxID=684658 RepID=A0A835CN49_APHGI|nr:hypothetical protein HCN44_000269 [Aphidius gifuensis]